MSELLRGAPGSLEADNFDARLNRWRGISGLTRAIIDELGYAYLHTDIEARWADWSSDQLRCSLQAWRSGPEATFYLSVHAPPQQGGWKEFYYSVSRHRLALGDSDSMVVGGREPTQQELEGELLDYLLEVVHEHPDLGKAAARNQAEMDRAFWQTMAREVMDTEADIRSKLRDLGRQAITRSNPGQIAAVVDELQARHPNIPDDAFERAVLQALHEAESG